MKIHVLSQGPTYIKSLKTAVLSHCPTIGRVQWGGTISTCKAHLSQLRLFLALQTLATVFDPTHGFDSFLHNTVRPAARQNKNAELCNWWARAINPKSREEMGQNEVHSATMTHVKEQLRVSVCVCVCVVTGG